ncbi:MAG: glycosyltransferase family 2 protein [Clostridia bacterium]|nr:glycosyltransferase family 2 protein [Clostridia bacterium]
METLISVIVPVYNVEKYLEKCIDSILAQTYKNLEIILVDDGSTDNSGKICDEYEKKDARIKVVHKENGGQGSARNLGLDICKGQFVSFVDSDDRIKPDMLERMLSALQKNSADIAICGIATNTGIKYIDNPVFECERVFNSGELMKEYVTTGNIHTGPCNKLYKRELFGNIRFPEIRVNEDYFIMHRLLGQSKKAVHTGENLYIQNIRPGSTEQSEFSERNFVLLDCAEDLIEYYKENFPDVYEFAAYNKVNDIAGLIWKIRQSKMTLSNRQAYKRLKADMFKEFEKIKAEVPCDQRLSKIAKEALFYPVRFEKNFVISRIKKKIKRCIRIFLKK